METEGGDVNIWTAISKLGVLNEREGLLQRVWAAAASLCKWGHAEMPRASGFVFFFRTEETQTPEPCQGLPAGVRSLVTPCALRGAAPAYTALAHTRLRQRAAASNFCRGGDLRYASCPDLSLLLEHLVLPPFPSNQMPFLS